MAGFAEFNDKDFQRFAKQFHKAVGDMTFEQFERNLLNDEADVVVKNAKKLTPVKVGRLRGAWGKANLKTGKEASINIVNTMYYAPFVNNGHRLVRGGKTYGFKTGNNMLEKAVDSVQARFYKNAENMLEKMLKEPMGE